MTATVLQHTHRRDTDRRWQVVLGWAAVYGGVRAMWTMTGGPPVRNFGSDLVGFTGWWAVALCGAAALVAFAQHRTAGWRPGVAVAGWAVAGCLVAAAAILLPEIVGTLLFAGPPFDPFGLAGRLGAVTGAVLLGLATARYQRRTRGDCPDCCRTGPPATGWTAPPAWAWWAAYGAVAGFAIRIGAQVVEGVDGLASGGSVIALEVGFGLAGVLLPLALVHSWGRRWPGWVPWLAGRIIPRPVLLIPAFGLGAGLIAYFGMGLAQLAAGATSMFPSAFLWVAMSAYCLLGAGLLAAATSYHRRSRKACGRCGR